MNPTPTTSVQQPNRVAVIGGGVSGLAAAFRLRELDPNLDVRLFEASSRLGGAVWTEERDGFLLEHGADMFTTKDPWAVDLCGRLGLADQLIETNPDAKRRRAFIVHRGRLHPVPSGFALMQPRQVWPMATTPLLSARGKLRLLAEALTPPRRSDEDESLASFARRRLGVEVYERLVQPLVGGIYTADPERLSMKAAMAQFVEAERRSGRLLKDVWRRRKDIQKQKGSQAAGARYGMFVAPRAGMVSLIDALASHLPSTAVQLSAPVDSFDRNGGLWRIADQPFDGVVLAVSASVAARILKNHRPTLAQNLADISYATASIVALAYRRDQIEHPLDGFGLVAPVVEKRRILAASFSSVKFADRAPPGCELIRVFVGGALQEELALLDDDELFQLAEEELGELLGVTGAPLWRKVIRWPNAMPQYHVGHLSLIERIEREVRTLPSLELAGNAYHGVGVPFCVKSGEEAAQRLFDQLKNAPCR